MTTIPLEKAKELVASGYKPYRRKSGKKEYMSIRKGKQEYGLGQFDSATWDQLQKAIPPQGGVEENLTDKTNKKTVFLGGNSPNIGRPHDPITEDWRHWAIRGGIHSSVIFFYEFATSKGYKESLSEFINETIEQYWKEHDKYPAIVGREVLEKYGLMPTN